MGIRVHAHVCLTIEYDKVLEFESMSEFRRYLVDIEYKDVQGTFNVEKVQSASNIDAHNCDTLKVDNVGEAYVLTKSDQEVEIYDFLRALEKVTS